MSEIIGLFLLVHGIANFHGTRVDHVLYEHLKTAHFETNILICIRAFDSIRP